MNPYLFNIDDVTHWEKHLKEEGYVVIKDILDKEQMDIGFSLFRKDWNRVSPNFNFDDNNTWEIKNCPLIFNKGMAVFNGFGHSDFMWNLRTNKNIQSIYKNLYKEDDLVVSFDGFSAFFSYKQKSKPWLHIDQNPRNTLYSVQGAYNFIKVDQEDAGFLVVPRSHLTYKPEVKHKKNWILCNNPEFDKDCVKLLIPDNCFTLWNSKLIHSNIGIPVKKKEFNRLTCYITYLPKSLRSEDVKAARIDSYMKGLTTSHWCNTCELKRYPFGFGKTYESRGYNHISPTLHNDNIPIDRLNLI